MPYQKKYTYSRDYKKKYRRMKKNKRYNAYGTVAEDAYAMGKLALSMLNSETKWFDTNQDTTPTGIWQAHRLAAIPQGTGQSERIGNKLKIKSIQLRGTLTANSAVGTAGQRIRLVLVLSKRVTPEFDPTEVFPTGIDTLRNMEYGAKYNVLMDRIVNLDLDTRPRSHIDRYWKKDIHVPFIGTGNNNETNDLYLMYIAETTVNPPSIDLNSRIRYLDN